MFSVEEHYEILFEVIVNTQRFNWKETLYFRCVYERVQPTVFAALEHLQKTKGVEIDFKGPARTYFKSFEDCKNIEIKSS